MSPENLFLSPEEEAKFREQTIEAGHEEAHGPKPAGYSDIKHRLEDSEFSTRKFKVLDLGGGIGAYAEQLEKLFPNKVEVFTTGLSKRNIRESRNDTKWKKEQGLEFLDSNYPDRYLKWRSILELNKTDKNGEPLEEFDCIVNTMGELQYGPRNYLAYEKYIQAITAKMLPGGVSFLTPAVPIGADQEVALEYLSRIVEDDPRIRIYFREYDSYSTLIIEKASNEGKFELLKGDMEADGSLLKKISVAEEV